MAEREMWVPLSGREEEFKAFVDERANALTQSAVEAVSRELPELVGPDPMLGELLARTIRANLENFAAAIAYHVPEETAFEPPAALEHARLLAQRGVSANSILRGYQVSQRVLTGPLIEAVDEFAQDREDLVRSLVAVSAYLFMQWNASSQASLRTHTVAREAWLRGRGAGLSKRVDSVLDGTVSEVRMAEKALNYAVSGKHVALIAWIDNPDRPLDMAEAERHVSSLPGIRDSLLVPRDERTLYAWLHTSDDSHMAEWMESAKSVEQARIAFGELAEGIEGFRLSHMQARSAGAVISASRRQESTAVVRFRDVAALSFMVDRPAESKGWAEEVLGDLARPREDRERLRETLRVFLEEGENAIATGERLFVHRNTVKYRVDRAFELLPEPLGTRRLEVGLALRYLDLVGAGGESPAGAKAPSSE